MEMLQTFSEMLEVRSLETRYSVHQLGLWHKSTQVYLFNTEGELLIQQRSEIKDLYPGLWADSVGEHLKPGESFEEGALRGLSEELSVSGVKVFEFGVLRSSDLSSGELVDREFRQAFVGRCNGPVKSDPKEVQAVSWISLKALSDELLNSPEKFSPSFLKDINELGLFVSWGQILERIV